MQALIDHMRAQSAHKVIISDLKELAQKTNISEHELVCLIWTTIMGLGDWNKKEEVVVDQALKHIKTKLPIMKAFTTARRSELALIVKVQEYCYENMNFMKAFQKIMVLLYKCKMIFIFTFLFCTNIIKFKE